MQVQQHLEHMEGIKDTGDDLLFSNIHSALKDEQYSKKCDCRQVILFLVIE